MTLRSTSVPQDSQVGGLRCPGIAGEDQPHPGEGRERSRLRHPGVGGVAVLWSLRLAAGREHRL